MIYISYLPLFLCISIGLSLRFGLLLWLRLLRLDLRLGLLRLLSGNLQLLIGLMLRLGMLRLALRFGLLWLLSGSLLRLIGLMLRLGMLRLALQFGLLRLLSGSLLRLIRLLLSVGSSRSGLLLFTLLGLFRLALLSGRLSVGAILCLLLFLGFVKTADIGICQKVGGTILRADSVTLVERFGLFATSVHLYHGTRTLCRDGDKIGCYRLIG